MDKNALQYALIEKVLHARMTFDDHHSHPGHLVTKVQEFENYFVEYLVEVSDSTGTVSGDYGNLGFGALGATIITHSDVSWKPISLNSRGWIPLTIIGNLPEAKLQYNSTLN